MIVIDDILEQLGEETLELDDGLAQIRARLDEEGDTADTAQLQDRVDQAQQAGLPAPYANAVRELLDQDSTTGSADLSDSGGDDMMELSLEPAEEPETPTSGYDITDGLPPESDTQESPETLDSPEAGLPEEQSLEQEQDPEQAGDFPESETHAEDHGLPPIQTPPTEEAEADDQDTDDTILPEMDENPPAAADDRSESLHHSDQDSHDVVMETRDNLPESRENFETLSERAVTTTTIIGALLGSRFELLTRISQDPYGTVYRARDHERDDANPEGQLCGVRVLPSRLARQASVTKRVQAIVKRIARLKHPGILKPVELHRDEEQAWVVTQLPIGSTLARFIRRECVKGLPLERALTIVKRIGAALASAHEQGVPHGDLKPSSIFIDDKDNIRIADFGIRTALYGTTVPTGQAGSTDMEQMDPIDAYLSLEIMEGSPPEPADDVYALACITASLLSGVHPFNGQSGLRRLQSETSAPRISALTRHQNQVLKTALASYRSERPQSVQDFLAKLEIRRGKIPKLPMAIAAGVLILIVTAWVPVQNFLEHRQQQMLVEELRDMGWPGMRGYLRNLDPDDRQMALESLAPELQSHYARTIESRLDDGDPLEANSLIDEGLRYFPENDRLQTLRDRAADTREALVEKQVSGIRTLLDQGRLGLDAASPDLPSRFQELRRLDPQHPLASRDSLRPHYLDAADDAAADADPDRASRLQGAADAIFAENDAVHDQIVRAMTTAEFRGAKQAAAVLAPSLAMQLPATSLPDVLAVQEEWRAILRLTGGHPLLTEHQEGVADTLESSLENYMTEGRWTEANDLLRELAFMFPSDRLETLRQRLTREQLADNYRPASLRAERQALAERRETVEQLLAQARMTPVWSGELIIAWRELTAWLRPGRAWRPALKQEIENLYLDAIREQRTSGNPEAAQNLLEQALNLAPESRALQAAQ